MSQKYSILFIADHASNFIPEHYNNLDLSSDLINSHIAYDLGVKELSIGLSKKFNASLIYGEYSRLLIDLNRGINDPTLISTISHGTIINMNYKLLKNEKKFRINKIYKKYHNSITDIIENKKINILVSLHSFNPSYKHLKRDIAFGVLSNRDRRYSNIIIELLKKGSYTVGDNEPYKGNLINDTMYKHGFKNNILHTCIETRNDLLFNSKNIKRITKILYEVIESSKKQLNKYI